MNEITYYLIRMLIDMAYALPAAVVWRLIATFLRKKTARRSTVWHEILSMLFVIIVAGILSQTIFVQLGHGELHGDNRLNLIPFKIISVCIGIDDFSFTMINIFGNIAVFAPLGFLLPLLWHRFERLLPTVLTCSLFSLLIEVIQYPLHRGTDIDDLILNTVGALVGYLIFRVFRRAFPAAALRCKVNIKK